MSRRTHLAAWAVVCLAPTVCLLSTRVAARPIYWASAPAASQIEVIASALDGALTASASTNVFSTSAATADLQGAAAPGTLSFLTGQVQLADRSLSFDLGEFGRIDAAIAGVGVQLPTGAFSPAVSIPGPPGYAQYDIANSALVINSGLLTYAGSGSLGGLLGSGSIDFAAFPLSFFAPPGTTAHLLKSAPGPLGGEVVLLGVPLDINTPVIQDPIPVDLRIRGQIVLYGYRQGLSPSLAVPEPASWVLLAVGAAYGIPAIRRKVKSGRRVG